MQSLKSQGELLIKFSFCSIHGISRLGTTPGCIPYVAFPACSRDHSPKGILVLHGQHSADDHARRGSWVGAVARSI